MWGSQNLHIGLKLIQERLKKAFVSYDASTEGNYDEDLFQIWKKVGKTACRQKWIKAAVWWID